MPALHIYCLLHKAHQLWSFTGLQFITAKFELYIKIRHTGLHLSSQRYRNINVPKQTKVIIYKVDNEELKINFGVKS